MRKKLVCCTVLLCVLYLTGCGSDKKVKENTLYVKNNGKIVGALFEKLDKDYYKDEELSDWILAELDSYNKENGKKTLKLRECEVGYDQARVSISYASIEDYADFNQVVAFEGTIAEAQKEGYTFTGEFKSTSDKPAITNKEINGSKEYKVLILEESQQLVMEEKILYVNEVVQVNDDNIKRAKVNASKQNLAFIIYK